MYKIYIGRLYIVELHNLWKSTGIEPSIVRHCESSIRSLSKTIIRAAGVYSHTPHSHYLCFKCVCMWREENV